MPFSTRSAAQHQQDLTKGGGQHQCLFPPGGGVLNPGLNNNVQHYGEQVFEGEAMEEFVNSAWRGQRTSEEREPFGREERTTERANFAPPQQEVFSGRK